MPIMITVEAIPDTTKQRMTPTELALLDKDRYAIQRDAAGRTWLRGPNRAMILVDAIETVHLYGGTLKAVVNGADVYIDGDPERFTGGNLIGITPEDIAKARLEAVEALVLANVSVPATQQKPTPAVGVAVGNDNAVAFQYDAHHRNGVVVELPLTIQMRPDQMRPDPFPAEDEPTAIYVSNKRLSFWTSSYGAQGTSTVIPRREAEAWMEAILTAVGLGVRYIDLVAIRNTDQLLAHARAAADSTR